MILRYEVSSGVLSSRVVLARPGQYWNSGTPGNSVGWEAMPADGLPLDGHLLTPTQYGPKGPPSRLWRLEIPAGDGDLSPDVMAMIYSVDGNGKSPGYLQSISAEYFGGGPVLYVVSGRLGTR